MRFWLSASPDHMAVTSGLPTLGAGCWFCPSQALEGGIFLDFCLGCSFRMKL